MFKFLKEKINKWTKKVAETKEKSEKETKKQGKTDEKQESKEKQTPKRTEKKLKVKKGTIETKKPTKIKKTTAEEKIKRIEEAETKEKETEQEKKQEKSGIFKKITKSITSIKLSEQEFNENFEELEEILIENNVALKVIDKIKENMKQDLVDANIKKSEIKQEIINSLKSTIENILVKPFNLIKKIKQYKKENPNQPYVIVFFGINGSGKTTTIAKIAKLLKKNRISSVLAAADTFRAASIEQLEKHGEKLNIKTIKHDYGSDPAAVGFDAIKYAQSNKIDCVLIDTAGRMHTEKNLLKEMEKIVKITQPNLKIFIGESITGNDATNQAKNFNESIGIDAIILSKADIDEKGGTALSIGYVTKKPILYLGTGQDYDKIEPFNKEEFLKKLGL